MEVLQGVSVAFYIAAGLLLLIGIILFFLLDVPALYGEVSGRTAKKAIDGILRENENTDSLVVRQMETTLLKETEMENETIVLTNADLSDYATTLLSTDEFSENMGISFTGSTEIIE